MTLRDRQNRLSDWAKYVGLWLFFITLGDSFAIGRHRKSLSYTDAFRIFPPHTWSWIFLALAIGLGFNLVWFFRPTLAAVLTIKSAIDLLFAYSIINQEGLAGFTGASKWATTALICLTVSWFEPWTKVRE